MEKLALFLYLTMRDHLPTGVVAKMIMDINEVTSIADLEYSNKHLENLAKDYAMRIFGSQKPSPNAWWNGED